MRIMKPLLILALVFMFVLSACSGSGSNPGNTTQPAPNPVQQQPATTPPAEEPKTAEPAPEEPKIDLNGYTIKIACFWDCSPSAQDTEINDLKKQRQAEVETKYNVKIEYLNVPYAEITEKTTTTALSGEPFADIIRLQNMAVPGLVEGGFLKALDDITDVNNNPNFDAAMKAVGTYRGKLYGFLEDVQDGAGLYYNRTMLESLGLEDPKDLMAKGEWTWAKFEEMAKAATKDTDSDGQIDQYGLAAWDQELASFLIGSNGARIADMDKGVIGLDSPEAIEALEFMYKLYHEDKVVMPSEGDPYSHPHVNFHAGKLLFTTGFTWEGMTRLTEEQMADDWGYVYMPKGPKATDYYVPLSQTNMFYMPAGAKYPAETIQIWQELQIYERVEDSFDVFMELAFRHQDDMDLAKEMPDKILLDYFLSFPKVKELVFSMATKIATGEEPPVTAVEKIKVEAQAALDEILK